MDVIVQIALNTVVAGSIYALVTLGFNLTYSTARFFDLSYGAVAAAAGYAVLFCYHTLGYALPISILIGILCAGALGFAIEKVVYRSLRARKATPTVLIIASLGVLTCLQAALAILFSSQFQTLVKDPGLIKTFTIAGGVITEGQLLTCLAALSIMLILSLVLQRTMFGKSVQAIADDEEVAQIVGIDTERTIGIVFFVGAAIAGAAGIATGFDTGLLPTIGLALLLKGIIGSIVGGIGNVRGGVAGAFFLALIENVGAWQFSGEWRDTIAFVVLIAFLVFRPRGLFPK